MKRKKAIYITALILPIVCIAVYLAFSFERKSEQAEAPDKNWESLYTAATKDAMTIEGDEVLPVLAIDEEEPLLLWEKGQVLLVTMHNTPESYPAGKEVALEEGELWVTSLAEMQEWFAGNYGEGEKEENWCMRFEALLGMPANAEHTHFSAFWVSPEDITRPAYNPDASDAEVFTAYADLESADEEYRKWFDGNLIFSYFESQYPWTRLGYTYDYMAEDTEYGLSEFLINANAKVTVDFTCTVEEMVEYLASQAEGNLPEISP